MNSRTNKLTNFCPTIVSQFIVHSLQLCPLPNIFNWLRNRRVIMATQSTSPNTMFDLLSRDFLSHRMLMTTEVKCAPRIDLIGGLFYLSFIVDVWQRTCWLSLEQNVQNSSIYLSYHAGANFQNAPRIFISLLSSILSLVFFSFLIAIFAFY